MIYRKKISFTLVELIIVTAIIGILSSIAIPNFLAVQNRAKISKAKSNMRILDGASQMYRVDWNQYPPAFQKPPEDPYGILSDIQLAVLTTPVSYIAPAAFQEPFGRIKSYAFSILIPPLYPDFTPPDQRGSLLFFNYRYFGEWTNNALINVDGFAVVSIGPDRKDSFGVFRPFPPEALPPLAPIMGIFHPCDTQYDPTNGTVSGGDIFRFSGEMKTGY